MQGLNKKEGEVGIIKASAPTKNEKLSIRFLIVLGLISMIIFVTWFFNFANPGYPLLYYPLTLALFFKLLRILHEWYHYAALSVPKKPKQTKQYTVDMLTTACPGEPQEMIVNTLKAMVAVRYPHTTYLCDEGDDPELKRICKELGVVHVTRKEKVNAKAGNINNALKQATGEICVVLDPDHEPHPDFLHRVLPYFEDPKLGYVQVVQAYGNQNESLIALGAAQQTYTFYGPMMMCMNSYGTVQAIGANCTFRRAALDSIGGHAAGLSEDMHTAMQLHAKGWTSVYVPEVLSRGYVPSSLPAYYKQQLKWSRGTFDLFFKVFWKLKDKFTWRQKIHYFTLPLYFLFGLISFIDLSIPILALSLSHTPWEVNISDFALMFTPLLILNLLIRQYAQRWLLEEHERGLHIIGGILRIGTWWVLLLGFIYTLLNIKVPYIPTPKDDEPQNNWRLCIPNLIVCFVTTIAIFYGTSVDKSPYSAFMAGFGLVNVAILLVVTIMAQEKFLNEISEKATKTKAFHVLVKPAINYFDTYQNLAYRVLRNGSVIIALLIIGTLYSFTQINQGKRVDLKTLGPPDMKNTGGFYTGIYSPVFDSILNPEDIVKFEKSLSTRFDIVSFYQSWGQPSINYFPMQALKEISRKGSIAMITWEPWPQAFPEYDSHPELSEGIKTCKFITQGYFDNYIRDYCRLIKDYGEPIFIRFAHEPDNTVYPWSKGGKNTPNEYIHAYRYVVKKFEEEGVFNVTWVWTPMLASGIDDYFPGGDYVDWIGLTALNYGKAQVDGKWYTFSQIYEPYRKKLESLKRPVMIAELGSTDYGGNKEEWIVEAMNDIQKKYTEIKSVVLFNSNKDNVWITKWRPSKKTKTIDWVINEKHVKIKSKLAEPPFNEHPFVEEKETGSKLHLKKPDIKYKSRFYSGEEGNYELMVDGEPFYIRGVAYNTAHDWRDGNLPLTRRQVASDMGNIKAMGANTIRRYAPGVYDQNILAEAKLHDLKVMYGFWFDPTIDYYRDTLKVLKYINEVKENVQELKHHSSILGWGVGNETWGILKHTYSKPYLVKVRNQYVKMIEHLAQSIHEIDSLRPVFTTSEHEENQLPGEIVSFHKFGPSIDVYTVNSYYEQQLGKLRELMEKHGPGRPYMVSEFGPKGYWLDWYTSFKANRIKENSDYYNSKLYAREWNDHVLQNKGYNIGGIAYCWRDRMEGTFTWYGITDYKGRFKPTYHALKACWKDEPLKLAIGRYAIEAPANDLEPGKEYIFKVKGQDNKKLQYQWMLQRDEYLGEVNTISTIEGGRMARVKIPNEPSKYRLYLFVSDDKGNVVTASEPINVKQFTNILSKK
jgi:cellulose synthase (UDP-forming)